VVSEELQRAEAARMSTCPIVGCIEPLFAWLVVIHSARDTLRERALYRALSSKRQELVMISVHRIEVGPPSELGVARHQPICADTRGALKFVFAIAAIIALGAGTQAKAAGAYTATQAASGATVYTQSCAQCHGANLQGDSGPPLSGPTFSQAYGTSTAAQLYDFISHQMPLNAPGSLSQQQYLDVAAYMLSRNGIQSRRAAI
jgi:mono/diheme cytochrome c family protein